MNNEEKIKELLKKIKAMKTQRGIWHAGVKCYAIELLEVVEENLKYINEDISSQNIKKILLNGADNFKQMSWGGSSLIYDYEIAERLAPYSQRSKNKPNINEEWLDTQARALYQGYLIIKKELSNIEDM